MLKICLLLLTLGLNAHEVHVNFEPSNFTIDESKKSKGEYTATIYMGTPPQAIDHAVMDTGSFISVLGDKNLCDSQTIPGAGCSTSFVYDSSESSTFTKTSQMISQKYDAGLMKGLKAQDSFCFDESKKSCQTLSFMDVYSENGNFKGQQGIFGLQPQAFKKELAVQSFISQINSTIEDEQFSIYYSLDTSKQSKVIFGPPEAQNYGKLGSTNDDLQWIDVKIENDLQIQQWALEIQSASLGDKQFTTDQFTTGQSQTAMIDSGTTWINMDIVSHQNLINEAYNVGITVDSNHCIIGCSDDVCSDFPSLKIAFKKSASSDDLVTLTLDSKFFIQATGDCNCLQIWGSEFNDGQWIIGQAFLHKFYTAFDYHNMKMGFVEQLGYEPYVPVKDNEKYLVYVGGLLVIAIILIGLCLYRRQQKLREQPLQQPQVEMGEQRQPLNVNTTI